MSSQSDRRKKNNCGTVWWTPKHNFYFIHTALAPADSVTLPEYNHTSTSDCVHYYFFIGLCHLQVF